MITLQLWATMLLSVCAQADQRICSFETQEMALLKTNNSGFQQIQKGASHALDITFHPSEWPNVLLKPNTPWNWSGSGALALDVVNPTKSTLTFGVRFDDAETADGWQHSRTANVAVEAGKSQTVYIALASQAEALGMRAGPGYPNGTTSSANGAPGFDASHVVQLQIFMHLPKEATHLIVSNLRTVGPIPMKGIVDRFGQYAKSDWPGKVHSLDDLKKPDSLPTHKSDEKRDSYGGWADGPKLDATGFFRTAKVGDKWSLVDPLGHLFVSLGVDTITPNEDTFTEGRESLFEELPKAGDPAARFAFQVTGMHSGPRKSGQAFNFYGANLYRKYGENYLSMWQESVLKRLSAWGFNTIGNWSDERFYTTKRMPYVATGGVYGDHPRIESGTDYWGKMHDPFAPQFKTDAENSLKDLIRKVKGDPWCIGYFVDNELSWVGDGPDGAYGLAKGALSDATSSARAAFIKQLKSKYGDLSKLNQSWQSSFDSWESVRAIVPSRSAYRTDASEFVHAFATKYFQTISSILKREDPNHLYLGCRLAWKTIEVEKAAAEVCDVVSYNIYQKSIDSSTWGYLKELNKPCIIGEFHFGAVDRGMFHPGLVPTINQAERAAYYKAYIESVAAHPSFVGCHWFQYVDEPLVGRTWDGENYNIGLVTVTDTPYEELTRAATQVQSRIYRLRFPPRK